MNKFYQIEIAGCKRNLKLYKINDNLSIAAFIIFNDVEVTKAAAKKLFELAPEYDIILTAECKSIPLAYEMASLSGNGSYIVARKGVKVYMENVTQVDVNSITTKGKQTLYLGQDDLDKLKGKRVLIVDDVISTGKSLSALEDLVKKAGADIAAKVAVLTEGDASERDDIIFLNKLPLFDGEGNILE